MNQYSVQSAILLPVPSVDVVQVLPMQPLRHFPAADPCSLPRRAPDRGHLTPREIEVLSWIAGGRSDWQVGQILRISPKTVNFHVERAKKKLGARTRTQAVVYAREYGLLARLSA